MKEIRFLEFGLNQATPLTAKPLILLINTMNKFKESSPPNMQYNAYYRKDAGNIKLKPLKVQKYSKQKHKNIKNKKPLDSILPA